MKGVFLVAKSKVEISGVNTSDIKVLSNKEMNALFCRLKSGDITVKEELVNGNLKLVLSILKKFSNRTDNMDDLFQIGCIGLIKSIDNFDLSHQVKFSTYAVPMILGEIKRYLRDNNSLRISRSIKDIAYKSLRIKEEFTTINGIEPTNKEVADMLGIEEIDVILAIESLKEPVSMNEPIYNDGGDTIFLCDQIEDKKVANSDIDINLAVDDAINHLEERERYIIDERYIMGKTQMEIAEELGISQAQISRLEKNAIHTLKKVLK